MSRIEHRRSGTLIGGTSATCAALTGETATAPRHSGAHPGTLAGESAATCIAPHRNGTLAGDTAATATAAHRNGTLARESAATCAAPHHSGAHPGTLARDYSTTTAPRRTVTRPSTFIGGPR